MKHGLHSGLTTLCVYAGQSYGMYQKCCCAVQAGDITLIHVLGAAAQKKSTIAANRDSALHAAKLMPTDGVMNPWTDCSMFPTSIYISLFPNS